MMNPEHHGKHIVGLWIVLAVLGGVGLWVWHTYLSNNPFGS